MTKRRYEIETRGHRWRLDEFGEIDVFGFEARNHNGPVCEDCGYGFCHHCQKIPDRDCSARPAQDGRNASVASRIEPGGYHDPKD
jgi:hypothetical protein